MIPNVPVEGSAVPYPLVSYSAYKRLTGDTTSAQAEVEEALDDAVQDISVYCGRTFAYGHFVENQYLYRQGMVYPSANPLDKTKPVSDGQGTTLYDPNDPSFNPGVSIIQGDGIWIGYFLPLPFIWTGIFDAQTLVSYWGGYFPYQYEPGVGDPPMTTETLPRSAALMFCKYAYYATHPVALVGVPAGVKSMSVGGVSMSGDLSAFSMTDPALRSMLRRWKNPMAHPWDA